MPEARPLSREPIERERMVRDRLLREGRNVARPSATRLTRRGWALLAFAAVCIAVAYGSGLAELLYAGGFLAVLPVCALVLVHLRRRRFSVVRSFSPVIVSAGSLARVDLVVRNLNATASGPATWADRIPWAPGIAGPGTLPPLAPSIPGTTNRGAGTRLRYTVRPPSRGIFTIGPLDVSYSDPFALASGSASLGGVQQLSVIPAVVRLGGGGPSILAGEGSARVVQRRTAGNDDDLMTREYRSGDALRRVHWRASARHGELMVRQEEQRTYPEARVLIDTFRSGYGDDGSAGGTRAGASGSGSFEWAVRMVASLGVHLHRAGYLVEVVETAPQQIAPLGNLNQGAGQDLEFLVSLAGVRPIGDTWNRHSAGDGAGLSGGDRAAGAPGPVFAVLSDPDPATLRWIAAQRRPFELGVAFVIGRRAADAVDALSEAGWSCLPVLETDDPAAVWAAISPATAPGDPAQGDRR